MPEISPGGPQSSREYSGRPKLCRKLVLAVTGSVGAASAVPRFLFVLRQMFTEEVIVVLSEGAQHFISPYVATICSGRPAVTDLYSTRQYLTPHIDVTESSDALIVMPATANIIGKAANGIADEIVSATILAAACPVVFVPNMNEIMWRKPIVQDNIQKLTKCGYHVIQPTYGTEVATFQRTFGTMPPFPAILRALAALLGVHPPSGPKGGSPEQEFSSE